MLRPYLYYALTYFTFLILVLVSKLKQGLRLFDDKGFASHLPMLFTLYIGGIFLLGVSPFFTQHLVPFVFFNTENFGGLSTWITVLLFILSLVITPRIIAKKFNKFPVTSVDAFGHGRSFYITYFIVRILFIGAYELWFRGYLLPDCIISFGVAWAIVINLVLYAILHLVNGRDEVIASIPYGLLLCSLCIWQGAVWPAVLIHLALTIPYEVGFLRKIYSAKSLRNENSHHRCLRLYRV